MANTPTGERIAVARQNILAELARQGATVTDDPHVTVNGIVIELDISMTRGRTCRATFGARGQRRWRAVSADGSIRDIRQFAADIIEYAAGKARENAKHERQRQVRTASAQHVARLQATHGKQNAVEASSRDPDLVVLRLNRALPAMNAIDLLSRALEHDPEMRASLSIHQHATPDLAGAVLAGLGNSPGKPDPNALVNVIRAVSAAMPNDGDFAQWLGRVSTGLAKERIRRFGIGHNQPVEKSP